MISERIKKIANLIEDSGDLADIGSDHGYLLFELAKNGFSHKLLGVENKNGPFNALLNEVKNINFAYKCDINAILSDGIKDLTPNFVNVVIAGMGYSLIKKIILSNIEKTSFIENFYIDAHTNIEEIRPFFLSIGYDVFNETMIFEKGIFYSLIHFKKTKEIQKYNKNELKYGPININRKEETFVLYLKSKREEFKRKNNDIDYLIEVNGIQHYKPIDFFGGIDGFEYQKKRDEIMIYIKEIEEILNEN